MTKNVAFVAVAGIPLIKPRDPLASILIDALKAANLPLKFGDVLVIAQKTVSKAENRYVSPSNVEPSSRAREYATLTGQEPRFVEVVLSESTGLIRAAPNVLIGTHRLGFVVANAGI